jgi:hypothetical protein
MTLTAKQARERIFSLSQWDPSSDCRRLQPEDCEGDRQREPKETLHRKEIANLERSEQERLNAEKQEIIDKLAKNRGIQNLLVV